MPNLHSPPNASLGPALRRARLATGKTLHEAARAVGVSRHALRHWEQGRYDLKVGHVVALARVYGVSPSSILACLDSVRGHGRTIDGDYTPVQEQIS